MKKINFKTLGILDAFFHEVPSKALGKTDKKVENEKKNGNK